MKAIHISLALVVAVGTGCSSVERSRNLADPAVSGKVLAVQVCSICHGIDGNSVSPNFPRLAGQQAAYMVNQLKNFRSHDRSDPPGEWYMWGISRKLTDKQIEEMAEYFSRQKPLPNAAGDPKLTAAGKEIYQRGVPEQNVIACTACHGPQGEGVDSFPRLAYQHADYIVKQLEVFQYTAGRPGTPMESITHPLTGSDKEAISTYLQAFPKY